MCIYTAHTISWMYICYALLDWNYVCCFSRRRSKRDDDPDWVPDSDVEEELSAMSGGPSYRVTRQKRE